MHRSGSNKFIKLRYTTNSFRCWSCYFLLHSNYRCLFKRKTWLKCLWLLMDWSGKSLDTFMQYLHQLFFLSDSYIRWKKMKYYSRQKYNLLIWWIMWNNLLNRNSIFFLIFEPKKSYISDIYSTSSKVYFLDWNILQPYVNHRILNVYNFKWCLINET